METLTSFNTSELHLGLPLFNSIFSLFIYFTVHSNLSSPDQQRCLCWNGLWCVISNNNVIKTMITIFFMVDIAEEGFRMGRLDSPVHVDLRFCVQGISKEWENWWSDRLLSVGRWWWTHCLLAGIWHGLDFTVFFLPSFLERHEKMTPDGHKPYKVLSTLKIHSVEGARQV